MATRLIRTSPLFVVVALLVSVLPSSAQTEPTGFIVYECGQNLCRVDSDGANQVHLTSDGDAEGSAYASPSLSRDGTLLAFTFGERAFVVTEGPISRGAPIFEPASRVALHPAGSSLAGIESGTSYVILRDLGAVEPFVLPNPHTTLAWASDLLIVDGPPTASGRQTLCLWENPACVRTLAQDEQRDMLDPAVSPDGGRLAVAACALPERQACNLALYAMNTGRKLQDVTDGLDDTEPAWSPDGQSVVFSRGGDLYVVPVDGGPGSEQLLVAGGRRATWGGVSEMALPAPMPSEPGAPGPAPSEPGASVPAPQPIPPRAQPPPPLPPPGTPEGTAVRAALSSAADRLQVPPDQLVLVRIEPREWSDASLGCPQSGLAYAQVITPGYLVTIATPAGTLLEVHTDANRRAVIC